MRFLTVLEVLGFGAISASAAMLGYALSGALTAAAGGLFVGGASVVYLVNAYALAIEEKPDAERP
jgi:hypothetical protein